MSIHESNLRQCNSGACGLKATYHVTIRMLTTVLRRISPREQLQATLLQKQRSVCSMFNHGHFLNESSRSTYNEPMKPLFRTTLTCNLGPAQRQLTRLLQPGAQMPYSKTNFSRSYSIHQGTRMSLRQCTAMLAGFSGQQSAQMPHRAGQTWLQALTLSTYSTCKPQT